MPRQNSILIFGSVAFAQFLAVTGFVAWLPGCSIEPLKSTEKEYYLPPGYQFDNENRAGVNSKDAKVIGIEEIGFAFLNEQDQTVALGSKPEISVRIETGDPTAVWSLYYTTDAHTLANGVGILKDLPATETKVKWDTSFVGAGRFQLVALVEVQGKVFMFRSKNWITIDGSFQPLAEPAKLSILSPSEGSVLLAGSSAPLEFEVLDDSSRYASFSFEYTLDGNSWQLVAEGVLPNQPVDWLVPDAMTALAKVRVVASMRSGGQSQVSQLAPFGITNIGLVTVSAVKPVIDASCVSCHGASNPAGGIRLDTEQRIAAAKDSIFQVTRVDAPLPMPPPSQSVFTEANRTLLALWQMSEP